jgi:hypothetical protein
MPETSQGAADLRRRAQHAFQSAYGTLTELEQVRDRRKVVIYISSGYDFDAFAAGWQNKDRIQGGRFSEPTRFLIDEENPYLRLPAVTADVDQQSVDVRNPDNPDLSSENSGADQQHRHQGFRIPARFIEASTPSCGYWLYRVLLGFRLGSR